MIIVRFRRKVGLYLAKCNNDCLNNTMQQQREKQQEQYLGK